MYVNVCVCVYVPHACLVPVDTGRGVDILKLELQVVVSYCVDSERATGAVAEL